MIDLYFSTYTFLIHRVYVSISGSTSFTAEHRRFRFSIWPNLVVSGSYLPSLGVFGSLLDRARVLPTYYPVGPRCFRRSLWPSLGTCTIRLLNNVICLDDICLLALCINGSLPDRASVLPVTYHAKHRYFRFFTWPSLGTSGSVYS